MQFCCSAETHYFGDCAGGRYCRQSEIERQRETHRHTHTHAERQSMYAYCSCSLHLEFAVHCQDTVAWNSAIAACASCYEWEQAVHLLAELYHADLLPMLGLKAVWFCGVCLVCDKLGLGGY